jgi:hypothetical protein
MTGLNIILRISTKSKRTHPAPRMVASLLRRVLICVAYASTAARFSLYAEGWTRGREIGTFPHAEVPFEPFVLSVWGGDGTHVDGVCSYYNVKSSSVEIGGQETPSGEFYPDLLYEISNGDGDWETLVAPSASIGKRITTIVEPRTKSRPLKVNLDMFLPFIGKVKYGRVVLQTIESAVFRIDELQPADKQATEEAGR